MLFASYFGGAGDDILYKLAADNCGNVSVVGQTTSADFPVAGAPYQDHYAGQSSRPNATVSYLQFNGGICNRSVVIPVGGAGPAVAGPRP